MLYYYILTLYFSLSHFITLERIPLDVNNLFYWLICINQCILQLYNKCKKFEGLNKPLNYLYKK